MLEIVTVKFAEGDQKGEFLSHDLQLRIGDRCIVTTDRGVELGMVVDERTAENLSDKGIHKALRRATERDLYLFEKKRDKEDFAYQFCRKRIIVRKLSMKLSKVEYLFDGSRVVFYFTAERRVDFRELVKDLARQLRTRIEMRQIGARDEARLVGGVGSCGRGENCSKLFMKELKSVSVRTVKKQGMGINMTRLSGMCGRLKCCLNFEAQRSGRKGRCGEDCSGGCG